MNKKEKTNSKINKKKSERGDQMLKFVLTTPFMLILLAALGFIPWLFWAQIVADVSAARGLRESSLNRGGDTVVISAGYGEFASSIGGLVGGKTAGTLGSPEIKANPVQRMVSFIVTGSTQWQFGPLGGGYRFGGGGAGRIHNFYAGPPDPWE